MLVMFKKYVGSFRELFWPSLAERDQSSIDLLIEEERSEVEEICQTNWSLDIDLALEEARRLYSEEDARRASVETKASNLLLVASALIPLVTYLESDIAKELRELPAWIYMFVFIIAMAYYLAATYWAFKVISVSNYYRVYPIDIVRIWARSKRMGKNVVIEFLSSIRKNQETINDKVSYFIVAQKFIFRAVISFSLLLLIRFFSGPLDGLFDSMSMALESVLSLLNLFITTLFNVAERLLIVLDVRLPLEA